MYNVHMKKIIAIIAIIVLASVLFFLSSGNSKIVKKIVELQNTEKITVDGEVTALYSIPTYFCVMTESSKPAAFIDFLYVEMGVVKNVRTVGTSCSTPGFGFENKRVMGEKLVFAHTRNTTTVTRENGEVYEVVSSQPAHTFFTRPTLVYNANVNANPSQYNTLEKISAIQRTFPLLEHRDLYLQQCKEILDASTSDACMLHEAFLLLDTSTCDEMQTETVKAFCNKFI